MSEQDGLEPAVPEPAVPDQDQPASPPEAAAAAPASDAPPPPTPAPPAPPAPAPPAPLAPLVAWDTPASPAPAPLVAWAPPPATPPGGATLGTYAEGPPPFTVGALLSDTFARYGADFLRLFLVAVATSAISWLSSFNSLPAPGTSPFARPTGFVDVRGLLGLANFIIGLVGGATLFALAEGGRGLPLLRALRRGIERAGWVFLTTLILGVGFIALFLLALIPLALFAIIGRGLVIVPILIVFVVFIWAGLRLSLALPAAVADNRNAIEALKLSWRVTRPAAVWGRLLGAAFLLGLLFLPAAIGTMLLVFPAMFASMFGSGSEGGTIPASVVFLVPAIVFSIFTPLTALLSFSAYRRLVPPLQPSWTAPPPPPATAQATELSVAAPPSPPAAASPEPAAAAEPPVAAVAPGAEVAAVAPAAEAPGTVDTTAPAIAAAPTTPGAPAFRVPRLGTAGKALLALALVADVVGIAAIPTGVGEMARFFRDFRGFPGFTPGTGLPGGGGFAVPGQVTFSQDIDLDTCEATFPFFIASPTSQVKWLAVPQKRVTPQDEVFLRITRDGQELETTLQAPGSYACLGSDQPIAALQRGAYTYELIVNGARSATGTLIVQ